MAISFKETDEWVEISTVEGKKTALHHVATICLNEKTYHVLSSEQDEADTAGFLLVREDHTSDGAQEFVITHDEQEIEEVIDLFVSHAVFDTTEDSEETEEAAPEDESFSCGIIHEPGEFCFCNDPSLLQ